MIGCTMVFISIRYKSKLYTIQLSFIITFDLLKIQKNMFHLIRFCMVGSFLFTLLACQEPASDADKVYNFVEIDDLDTFITTHPDLIIIDVRTDKEVSEGIINNAINIDFKKNDFKKRIQELDTEKTYLLYCRTNRRSSKAYTIMEKENFKNLYLLNGNYTDWKEAQKSD